MEVADNKNGGAGQGKAPRLFKNIGETKLIWRRAAVVAD